MILALVLLVCGLLAVIGAASYLQSAGTGRAFARVLSMRSAVEAGDAALAEASAAMRISLDTGARNAVCPEDWRDVVIRVLQGTQYGQMRADPEAGRTHLLHAVTTLARVSSDDVPVKIDDVKAKILNCYVPDQASYSSSPPQALLEMSVTVRGPGRVLEVVRTVRQRRVLHATIVGTINPTTPIQPKDVLLFLTIDPVGTVID